MNIKFYNKNKMVLTITHKEFVSFLLGTTYYMNLLSEEGDEYKVNTFKEELMQEEEVSLEELKEFIKKIASSLLRYNHHTLGVNDMYL